MVWTIIIIVVVIIIVRFSLDVNKDNYDLQGTTLADKFEFTVAMLNDSAFAGRAEIIYLDNRCFNLWQEGKNQIIQFTYGTGHLTITWKYKYFQKEVIHEKVFRHVRNISIFDQRKIAERMIKEMEVVVAQHQMDVIDKI